MSSPTEPEFTANIARFSGFADVYDAYRPRPPAALADVLCALAGVARPALVVDLGCGTGSSTRYWAERAKRVMGIEPSADMRRQAEAATQDAHVTYRAGFSHETGMPNRCADIITCSQSLHWMLPEPTFAEAARVLRPNGVFAAYDYDWPPITPRWQVQEAYKRFRAGMNELEQAHSALDGLVNFEKSGHLRRMRDSGRFRFTREFMLHHSDEGSASRLVGLAFSLGTVQTLLKLGLSPAEIGIERLRQEVLALLGDTTERWYWTSRVRVGII
jgi:SAM-dependent methyltransferase